MFILLNNMFKKFTNQHLWLVRVLTFLGYNEFNLFSYHEYNLLQVTSLTSLGIISQPPPKIKNFQLQQR